MMNPQYFGGLSGIKVLYAFAEGIRFDLSIILVLCVPFLLLLSMPVYKRWWLWLNGSLLSFVVLVLLAFLVGDVLYFKEGSRHVGEELMVALDDISFMFSITVNQFWYYFIPLIVLLVLCLLSIFFANRYHRSGHGHAGKMGLAIVLLYLGITGGTGWRLLELHDAYLRGMIWANLVVSGPFHAFHVLKREFLPIKNQTFDTVQAIKMVKTQISWSMERYQRENLPLVRRVNRGLLPLKFPNIMIVVLESWSGHFVDSYSDGKLGVTPYFDKLSKEGVQFTNFYPNGSASLFGLNAILTGNPQSIRTPILGKGLENHKIFRIGKEFKAIGYSTFFAQTALRRSFKMDQVAESLGFSDYFGKEDYQSSYASSANGRDDEMYMFVQKFVERLKKPFLGVLFTGSTHIPYQVDKRFWKYPHDGKDRNGFFNSLYFADYAIEQFMESVRRQDWFENTVFFFVADHTLERQVLGVEARIPLLIYCPKYLRPKKTDMIASQVDIIPTIAHLMGPSFDYTGIGKSLFASEPGRIILVHDPPFMGIANEKGYLRHDLQRVIESFGEDRESLTQMLLASEQLVWELTLQDRMFY